MSKLCVDFPVFVAAGVCAWLAGCGSGGSEPAASNQSNPQLASLESELAVAQGSLGGALDDAKACFEDFKTCKAGTGTDCVEDLKACLPAPASLPAPAAGAAGAAGAPSRPGFFGFGGGKLPTFGSGPAGAGFAGAIHGVDPAALAACKDSVGAAAAAKDPAALGDAFKACVGNAFADLFADLCERIATACDAAAPADVCDRLSDACNDPALNP